MAGFSEPWSWTQQRRQDASSVFPVLNDTSPDDALGVDAFRSSNGLPPSAFSQSAMSLAVHATAPEPQPFNPDAPDAAPNVEGWTPNQPDPRDPYGIRAPYQGPPEGYYGASSSPGETLRNVAGVFNPFTENSVFGSFYQGDNPVLQELLRPANYVGAGGGVRGLARGALSGIGGRVVGEAAMEAVPEDAPEPLRIAAGIAGGLVGGVAGYRAIDDVPRLARTSATWMSAADEALAKATGAVDDAIRTQAPEAFQAGRVPGTDKLFTLGPNGESVGPTGAVREIRLGREPVMGEDVNRGLRLTNLGVAEYRLLDDEIARRFQPVIDSARASLPRETAGMTDQEVGRLIGDMWVEQRLNKAASMLARFGEDSQWRFGLSDDQLNVVSERARQMADDIPAGGGGAPIVGGADRGIGGGAGEGLSRAEQMAQARADFATRNAVSRPEQLARQIDDASTALAREQGNFEHLRQVGPATAARDAYSRVQAAESRLSALYEEARGTQMPPTPFDNVRIARPESDLSLGEYRARIGGGADLTPADFARLTAKKAAGEALTPDEQDSVLQALGKAMGATTADEQAAAREALYNGPVPTDMREVDTGLIEGVRRRLGAPTGSSVEDALRAAREGEPPRIGGGADVPGEPPMARVGNAGDDAVQALRDALDAEVALRKSGQIASEISAGRSRQAGRIASGLEGMRGASLEDRIRAASGAARGQLRETFQQPLELTQEHVTALADRLQDALEGNQFEQLNGLRALNALVNGENVQPAQLKLLQRVYGDDIAGLAQRASIGRRAWKAGIDEPAMTRVERAARFGEKQIARYEEQATAQFKLADDLTEQLNLDPTNAQLKDAVAKARQAGEMAQMRADDLLSRRTMALEGDPVDALESLARQRQASEGVKALRDAELAQRAGKELTPEQDALLRARDIVGRKLAISSPKAKEVMNAVDALQKGDRAILDAIQNDRPFYRGMQAWLTGDIADSFLSAALQRRALASTVLERQGVQPEIARKMASTLFDAELQRHYNGNVPESAKRILQDAMRAGAQDADLMPRGLELLVQRAKNTMFGLGDFGVLGVQGLNALRRGSLPLLTGTINRGLAALHLPHVSTVVDDVDRMTQYAIDGLHMGTGPSMARPDAGTLFSYLGRPGRTLDEKVLNRAGNAMNEVQFGKILGTMRNIDHEGNLVMLKMLGRDISNPTVRAQAAQNANTLTSFARTALSGNRRAIETIALTSPSMTRARINSIKEMANLINPRASTEQRIMAASMLFSTYVVYAGLAKALNDAIGTGELEMEPGKKGFGMIRSRFENKNGQNILIDVIPQDSVERAFAQSIEALRDPNVDDIEIQRAWEKVMLGSGSIVTRGAAAGAFRTGFEPGKGYRFGNLSGEGMVKSVLPIPPSVQSLGEGATTPLEIGLTAAGISNYPDAGGGGTSRARPTRATPSRQRPTRSSR